MAITKDKLEKINYKLPLSWKIPFYELIGGKLKFTEFEEVIFEIPDLETIIGKDTYFELINFNFYNTHYYNDIVNLILKKILFEENDYNCKLFTLIGEFYQTDIELKTKNAKNLPEAVLDIFEGAHIHPNWDGFYEPAYDIEFLNKVSHLKRPDRGCFNALPLGAVIIGYAAKSYITLLMDDDGLVYISIDVSDELYCGCDFFEALKKLFFGLKYGDLLCSPHHFESSE